MACGSVGVGKSTVAAEAARLLREADVPHALADLAWITAGVDPVLEGAPHERFERSSPTGNSASTPIPVKLG